MKLMDCPKNGVRNISEFIYGGEVSEMPDPNTSSDREWAHYLFMNDNRKGVVREWWMHIATSYWFIAERNTETNDIIKTYPAIEIYNQRIDYQDPEV